MVSGKRITVLGAGIGGLATALALARRGFDVQVLEQADAIREVGAGIQVSPNGMRVLAGLGLGPSFGAVADRAQAVCLRDYARGRTVVRLDLDRYAAGQAYQFVHRADLIAVLADAVRDAGAVIRLAQRAAGVTPGARAQVALSEGTHQQADLVVGADGLHSVLRPVLNGAATPFFTKQVAWRALVPNTQGHPAQAHVHMGPGRHIVSYPIRGGALVNLVAVEERDDWVDEGWHHAGDAAELRARFADFAPVMPLLEQVTDVGVWGLFRHPVARHWWGPGVVLVGDAAHPTLPFLAQGATMALEDGYSLAACLAQETEMDAALERYQHLRHARVRRVIAAASGNARKYHLRNRVVRGVAHLGLGVIGRVAPSAMIRSFDWLYAYDATTAVDPA